MLAWIDYRWQVSPIHWSAHDGLGIGMQSILAVVGNDKPVAHLLGLEFIADTETKPIGSIRMKVSKA